MDRPSSVPADATLVINGSNEVCAWGEARLHGRAVARVAWALDGRVLHETPLGTDGTPHGVELEYDDAGHVVWCARWVGGQMHGPAVQLDEHGSPLVATSFVHGRGVDIWMSCGEVSEVRELERGAPHGLMRWGNPMRPYEEGHYKQGMRHGIFRQWTEGALDDDHPQFYVDDVRVSHETYEVSRRDDVSLPAYNPADDENHRSVPDAVTEALNEARRLATGFSLDAYLRDLNRG